MKVRPTPGPARPPTGSESRPRPAGIAEALRVSHSAVEKYISNIFMKLDLPPTATEHRRVLAVLRYLRT
jgi:hypothetical protein